MDINLKFHHLGYAVKSIENTLVFFKNLGYSFSEIYVDVNQKVQICLLKNENSPMIELVQGISEETSPIKKLIDKNGVIPYHICYSTPNINSAINTLRAQSFILLFNPVGAIAFSNKKICYMFNPAVGLIVLIEL